MTAQPAVEAADYLRQLNAAIDHYFEMREQFLADWARSNADQVLRSREGAPTEIGARSHDLPATNGEVTATTP